MIVRKEGQEVEGQQAVVGIVVLEIRVIRVEAGQGDAAAVVRVEPVTEVRGVVTAREAAVGTVGMQEVTMVVVVVIDLTPMQGQAAAQPSNLPMIYLIPLQERRKMPSVRDMVEGAILASSRRRRAVLVVNQGEVHAVVVVGKEEAGVIAGIDRIMIGTMMTNSRVKVW
jgi:hypothetical protein